MKKCYYVFSLIFIVLSVSVFADDAQHNLQTSLEKVFKLHNGDLIFQNVDCGPMCDAINEVTQGYHGAKFSHVGIITIDKKQIYVIEAISKGVSITSLSKFLSRSLDNNGKPRIAIGRLNKKYQQLIPQAICEARKLVGKPYDDYFDISNDSYYCSELVYFAFLKANNNKPLFQLAPMTYKSPKTNKIFPVWDDYFKNLNIPVPEGKPGINPGGISRSEYLKVFFPFK